MSSDLISQKLEDLEVSELEKLDLAGKEKSFNELTSKIYNLIEKYHLNPIRYIPFLVMLPHIEAIYNVAYLKKHPFTNHFHKITTGKKELLKASKVKTNISRFIPGYMLLDFILLKSLGDSKDPKNRSFGHFLSLNVLMSFLLPYYSLILLSKFSAAGFVTNPLKTGQQRFIFFNIIAYIFTLDTSSYICNYLFRPTNQINQEIKSTRFSTATTEEKLKSKVETENDIKVDNLRIEEAKQVKLADIQSSATSNARQEKTFYQLSIKLSNNDTDGIGWIENRESKCQAEDYINAFKGLPLNDEFINIKIKGDLMTVKGLKFDGKMH